MIAMNDPSTPRHYSDEQKVEAKDDAFWKRFMPPWCQGYSQASLLGCYWFINPNQIRLFPATN